MSRCGTKAPDVRLPTSIVVLKELRTNLGRKLSKSEKLVEKNGEIHLAESMLPCPNKGCIWKVREAGLHVHMAKCPFKPSAAASGATEASRRRKRRRLFRAYPKSLGGNGERIPADNVYMDEDSAPGGIPYETAQAALAEKMQKVEAELRSLRGCDDSCSSEEVLTCNDMDAEDVAKALALFLQSLSSKIGAATLNQLLTLIQHPSYKTEVTASKYTSKASLKIFVQRELRKFEDNLEQMGFKAAVIEDGSGASCKMYLRDPVALLKYQLKHSCWKEMFYNHIVEVNRNGERIYNHPMSGKLAEEGFPLIREAIMAASDRKDAYWSFSRENFIGAVQLYSDKSSTTLAANSLVFYPLHLTLLNFKQSLRRCFIQKGVTKLAFLPVYMFDAEGNAITGRETKMRILHRALERAFAPLIDVCWKGFSFVDRDGITRHCYPCLGNFITDIPEGKDLTSILHGNNTYLPCTRCLVRKEDLALSFISNNDWRTTEDTLRVQGGPRGPESSLEWGKGERLGLLKSRSMTKQISSLTTWPFLGLHPMLDLYRALSYEPMHNLPLGVGKLIKECAQTRLNSESLVSNELITSKGYSKTFSSVKATVLAAVNRALGKIQTDSPASGFFVDFQTAKLHNKLNGFYTSNGVVGMLEASDYNCLDQVFPFMGALMDRLCGEVQEAPTTKVMTMYSDMARFIYRRGMDAGFTTADIEELMRKVQAFKDFARKMYAEFQGSGMATLKFHMLDHVASDIERLGSVASMDAGLYESAHREVKENYRGTSRRKGSVMDETVDAINDKQALERRIDCAEYASRPDPFRRIASLAFARKRSLDTHATSSKRETVAGGSAALVQKGVQISYASMVKFLRCGAVTNEGTLVLEQERDALKFLACDIGMTAIKGFCKLLREKACEGVKDPSEMLRILSGLRIERVKSGFVASMDTPTAEDLLPTEDGGAKVFVTENGRRTVQRVVCAHSFYNSKAPRMDCVMVQAAPNDEEGDMVDKAVRKIEVYFAKALILFRARSSAGPFASTGEEEREFVLLRYFDIVSLNDNADHSLGCIKLRWSRVSGGIEADQPSLMPWYDLQNIATLRGRVHVIRGDYCLEITKSYKDKQHWTDQWFYVNRFKYDSSEPFYYEEDLLKDGE